MNSVLGRSDVGSVSIDLDALVKTRALLTANSGAGKSWAIRRILEQTHGKIQHFVIDLEGEFFTLRERFDYVLAGKGGDTAAEPRSAALLARRLLELHASAVLDLYELNPRDRILFVKNFVTALVDAPKDLWHPVLVVVDEAHHFAPEDGSAESSDAIAALMSRGRKRGYAGVLATQRLSKLSKDVAAEANNLIIGRCGLDVDIKRAAKNLGMNDKDAFERLRALKPGTFFVYGPALSDRIVEVKIGDVQTSHPQAGTMQAKAPAPRAKVLAVLSKLSDLPKEAEAEARTTVELQAKVRALEAELRKRPSIEVPKVEVKEISVLTVDDRAVLSTILSQVEVLQNYTKNLASDWRDRIDGIVAKVKAIPPHMTPQNYRGSTATPSHAVRTPPTKASDAGALCETLTGPEQRILNAIAWLNSVGVREPRNEAVAFVAGYAPGGGAYGNPRGRLSKLGLISIQNGTVTLTEAGSSEAVHPREGVTVDELHKRVMDRLDGPMQRILAPLLASYPEGIENSALARKAGYEPNGGAYGNPRGRLKTLGLIEYRNGIAKASPFLFFE